MAAFAAPSLRVEAPPSLLLFQTIRLVAIELTAPQNSVDRAVRTVKLALHVPVLSMDDILLHQHRQSTLAVQTKPRDGLLLKTLAC
jgi:hypothetical protein